MGLFLEDPPESLSGLRITGKKTGTVRVVRKVSESPSEEKPVYKNSAALILERGFDVVIFGHTHRVRTVEVNSNKFYYNTGSWFDHPHYIEINNGNIKLNRLDSITS